MVFNIIGSFILGALSSPPAQVRVEAQRSRVAIVSGASGEIGRETLTELAKDPSYQKVIGITADPEKLHAVLKKNGIPEGRVILVNRANKTPLDKQVEQAVAGKVSQMVFINTVGGTPKETHYSQTPEAAEKALAEVNSVAAQTLITAIGRAAERSDAKELMVIHLSSITVSLAGNTERCRYAKERKKTEEVIASHLKTVNVSSTRLCSLRAGFVIATCKETVEGKHRFDTGYLFGMHHMRSRPVLFGFGDGRQPMQPVHVTDLIEAAQNAANNPSIQGHDTVIDCVDRAEGVPYLRFIGHLNPRIHTENGVPAILLPLGLAETLSEIYSNGHLQPYAVAFVRKQQELIDEGKNPNLDPTQFEQLLGHPPRRYEDELGKVPPEKLECPSISIRQVAQEVAKNLSWKHVKELSRSALEHGSGIKIARLSTKPSEPKSAPGADFFSNPFAS